jgi:succinate dehydrogenase (ubiquinone) membrane anchor subunit
LFFSVESNDHAYSTDLHFVIFVCSFVTSGGSFLNADTPAGLTKAFHATGAILALTVPAMFIDAPVVSLPLDLVLGFVFPLHAHVAMNYVITDYVPKASRGIVRMVVLATTVITTAGLLKLNVSGPGFSATIKSLWRKQESATKA